MYSTSLEFSIDLPGYGERAPKDIFWLPDMIEMRGTEGGYELVLLTREQGHCWPETTRGKGVVLFSLPYTFFWSLQGDRFESHKKATEILGAAGLTYHSDAEVHSAWDYRNKYGSFRWWDV